MAAIVKANAHLTNGGLSVLKRGFTTSDDGLMTYSVEYVCLSQHAAKWTPYFKTLANPPTDLPRNMLRLTLDKTPELYDLQTETLNGLTYFRASYSAGVSTEVIITESTEQRSYNGSVDATVFQTTAKVGLVFDYMATTVTASAKNKNLPEIKGTVGPRFNVRTGLINGLRPIILPTNMPQVSTIESSSKSRTSRGEYTYSKSSTGIYADKEDPLGNGLLAR